MGLSLELTSSFYLCALSNQLFNMTFIYALFFLVTPCFVGVAQLCMKKNWTERDRRSEIIIQSNDFISVHFSFDTGKYLFTKIYVLINAMKCFVFLGGVMFKIFWGSQIPITTGGFCTKSGVIEIKIREVFLYYYIFILLFQGSVVAVHMLILYSWYPLAMQVPPFLGANSQQRWTNPFLQTFEYRHYSGINQQR